MLTKTKKFDWPSLLGIVVGLLSVPILSLPIITAFQTKLWNRNLIMVFARNGFVAMGVAVLLVLVGISHSSSAQLNRIPARTAFCIGILLILVSCCNLIGWIMALFLPPAF